MQLLDLTHTIKNNMIAYCKKEIPNIYKISTVSQDGYEVNKLSITTHTSTHIDAPAHISEGKNGIDSIPLETFSGKGVVVNCSNILSNEIPKEILKGYNLKDKDFIFFYTGHDKFWNCEKFLYNYKYPCVDLCKYISTLKLKGVGTDAISIDGYDKPSLLNHHILLKNNMIIVENLNNLSYLLNKDFHTYLFPLKIKYGDASPIRAVAKIK